MFADPSDLEIDDLRLLQKKTLDAATDLVSVRLWPTETFIDLCYPLCIDNY